MTQQPAGGAATPLLPGGGQATSRRGFVSALLAGGAIALGRGLWPAPPAAASPAAGPARTPTVDELIGRLSAVLPERLAQHRVPGAAVAVVHRGEPIWSGLFGLADRASESPVTRATVFQVASISKPVTAWGVARLVEAGRLDLDAPIEAYLTRWRFPPSEFDASAVTARRLLSHTAGLAANDSGGFDPRRPLPSLVEFLEGAGLPSPVRVELEPGGKFRYSGAGYAILQLAVEEVTGLEFAEYMAGAVLGPLGMTASAFRWTDSSRSATATPYSDNGRPLPVYQYVESAAAGLYATVDDLARFAAAGLVGPSDEALGRGVVSPSLLDLMYSPAAATQGQYGLGHYLWTLEDGSRLVWHGGSNRGWKSLLLAQPERREAIVLLTNGDTGTALKRNLEQVWLAWLGVSRRDDGLGLEVCCAT